MAPLQVEKLRTVLGYDPETGLFSRKDSSKMRPTQEGKQLGSLDTNGYRRIRVGSGLRVLAHRLAWFYVYGCWPKELDHQNGDKDDNRFANLREATRSQNMANAPRQRNNTSGVKGVHYDKANARWMAYMHVGGRFVNLGRFYSKEAAITARAEAFRKAFGVYAR